MPLKEADEILIFKEEDVEMGEGEGSGKRKKKLI